MLVYIIASYMVWFLMLTFISEGISKRDRLAGILLGLFAPIFTPIFIALAIGIYVKDLSQK